MQSIENQQLVATYPFVPQARAYLQENEPKQEQLEEAARFVLQVALGERRALPVFTNPVDSVTFFTLAKLIATSAGWGSQSRYASNYSKLVRLSLEQATDTTLIQLIQLYFPSATQTPPPTSLFAVPVLEMLSNDEQIASKQVHAGKVHLNRQEVSELIGEKSRERIMAEVDTSKLPPEFAKAAEPVKQLLAIPEKTGSKTKFLDVNCIKKALEGTPEGKRYYGAMALSIACIKDALPRQEAEQVLRGYAERCAKGGHDYTLHEALSTLDWVYKHPGIGFSCNVTRMQGLASLQKECVGCPLNETRFSKSNFGGPRGMQPGGMKPKRTKRESPA